MKNENFNDDFMKKLIEKIKQLLDLKYRPANEVIIDDVELREKLKISRRTSLNYRNSGNLKHFKIENKIYYFLSDVFEFIRKYGGGN